jgi:hypothetical protein
VTIIVCSVAGVFLLWAAWWVYRGTPKHGKHYTTVAAHHPLPPAVDLAKAMYEVRASGMHGADAMDVLKSATAGPDTAHRPAPRHTHRDPTTGRYTRKEQ